ncbi:MAG TPA: HEAT repeat domain-containing protein [Tepidisphaeraceae bacterium]|jgi:putative heme-binding domain-containing protein|nr:HEAT repeat domain-containing protein [Tepidisphaeraceae bacterium]
MMNRSCFAIALAVLGVVQVSLQAAPAVDPFGENIRPTDALSPQEEQKAFHLPPGFEIELVASEPQIGKPMNIAFDDKGRLWVSCTTEYPFPSLPLDKPGKDKIQIITFNDDGSTKSIEPFATGLNIPVGMYPYKNGCFAYSIPMISFYQDTDGDGKADKVSPYYGPFDFSQDTHGMSSNFVRGFDGWIYGCHGWANTSTVHGLDGQSITMPQGHTYRYKTDGSHIEIYTHGQTNPFGLCLDPLGNLYSADSHSKPIYSLLRGGYYESLRPRTDGLGYAPPMMNHLHGSTAIAAVMYYGAEQWPAEYRGNMFVGNVVTSRINRDSITYSGSSPTAHEEPDFVTTDDPWFRPNQIKVGPDGAVYVSDFYNKIIGHYEVPLDNPLRDYTKGRIWRITYKGTEPHAERGKLPNFTTQSVQQLIDALSDQNLAVRMLATDELSDRVGEAAIEPLQKFLEGTVSPFAGRHALWALYRLNGLGDGTLLEKMNKSEDAGTRVQVVRILGETKDWTPAQKQIVMAGLKDADGMVRRSAADALGQHPNASNVAPLLELLASTDKADTHLIYVLRMSLRDQLKADGAFKAAEDMKLGDDQMHTIVDIALAVPTAESAAFLTRHIDQVADKADTGRVLKQAAQNVTGADLDSLIAVVRKHFANDVDFQLDLLNSIRDGLVQRGTGPTPALRAWGVDLAGQALKAKNVDMAWSNGPVKKIVSENPWTYEPRQCEDGTEAQLLSSRPRGEQLTGVLTSKPFEIPPTLSFYLAGHMGDPGSAPNHENKIRLMTVNKKKVVARAFPPRNDVAKHITWDTKEYAGQMGYLEITDADQGGAYAWIAFGRLNPSVVPMPLGSPSDSQKRKQVACGIVGSLKLTELLPDVTALLNAEDSTVESKTAAALALAVCGSDDGMPALAEVMANPGRPEEMRQQIATTLAPAAEKSEGARAAIIGGFKGASNGLQLALATSLSSSKAGAEAFLDAVGKGTAPAALLFNPSVTDRLTAVGVEDVKGKVKQLTRGLPAPDDRIRQLITERAGTWRFLRPNAKHGGEIFSKNCMVCHSIDGHGATVGPQLDGIGNRGLERVMEDVLDPNRNVDPAFRYSNLFLKDGTVLTGLQRRDNGDTLTFTDSRGKEVTVNKDQIQKRSESKSSLMPANFSEVLPASDFYDLIAFLMEHKPAK